MLRCMVQWEEYPLKILQICQNHINFDIPVRKSLVKQ